MKQSLKEIETTHLANELYKIVLDIEKYPDYIPWCTNIEILKKEKNMIEANMFVSYKFFPIQKFTSNVVYNLEKLFIKTKYINGPLKNLDTKWEFLQIKKNQSKVIFSIDFEFQNFFHQKFAELFFPLIEDKMIKSFIGRADKILD